MSPTFTFNTFNTFKCTNTRKVLVCLFMKRLRPKKRIWTIILPTPIWVKRMTLWMLYCLFTFVMWNIKISLNSDKLQYNNKFGWNSFKYGTIQNFAWTYDFYAEFLCFLNEILMKLHMVALASVFRIEFSRIQLTVWRIWL